MSMSEEYWSGTYILNDAGNPVPCKDTLEWGRWFETSAAQRRVAYTEVAPGVQVSTVFLGLDHSFAGPSIVDPLNYRPILWETMVFGGPMDTEMRRYRSREAAELGHAALVEEAQRALAAEGQKIADEAKEEEPNADRDLQLRQRAHDGTGDRHRTGES